MSTEQGYQCQFPNNVAEEKERTPSTHAQRSQELFVVSEEEPALLVPIRDLARLIRQQFVHFVTQSEETE